MQLFIDCICAVAFIIGVLLAGSDGALFPWPNLFGLFCMLALVVFVNVAYPMRPRPWRQ